MPFFKYTTEFPFIHKCPESEAQFCDIPQLNIERRKTVRAKRHAQHTEPAILPSIKKDTVIWFGGDSRSRHRRWLDEQLAKQQAGR